MVYHWWFPTPLDFISLDDSLPQSSWLAHPASPQHRPLRCIWPKSNLKNHSNFLSPWMTVRLQSSWLAHPAQTYITSNKPGGQLKKATSKNKGCFKIRKKARCKKIGSVGGVTPYQESWNHEKWMFEQKLGFHLNRIFHRYTYIHVSDFPLKSFNIALLYISRSFWIW